MSRSENDISTGGLARMSSMFQLRRLQAQQDGPKFASTEGKTTIEILEEVRSKIGGLGNRGLKSHTRYGEDEMRSRCWDVVNGMIKSLQDSSR